MEIFSRLVVTNLLVGEQRRGRGARGSNVTTVGLTTVIRGYDYTKYYTDLVVETGKYCSCISVHYYAPPH